MGRLEIFKSLPSLMISLRFSYIFIKGRRAPPILLISTMHCLLQVIDPFRRIYTISHRHNAIVQDLRMGPLFIRKLEESFFICSPLTRGSYSVKNEDFTYEYRVS